MNAHNLRLLIPSFLTAITCGLLEVAAVGAPVTSPAPPIGVDLYYPENGATVTERRPQFVWSANYDASWCYLYLSRNGSKYLDAWISWNFVWVPDKDLPAGNYTWWVHPWNSDGFGPWSSSSSFTIPVSIPEAVAGISPTGQVNPGTWQQYMWGADSAASWYELYVSRNGKLFLDRWYSASELGNSGMGDPWVDVGGHYSGNYQWWVRGWSPDGLGPWSEGVVFNVPTSVPGTVTLTSPSGNLYAASTQCYSWQTDACATWYELCICRNGKFFSDRWYHLSNSVAAAGTGLFSVNVSGHLGGTYQWWVRGWSPDGLGAWSSSLTAQIPANPPSATTLISPTYDAYLYNPLFSWTAVDNATWYQIYIRKDGAYYYSTWLQGTSWQASWDISSDPGNYEWAVMAWNEDGVGPWSEAWNFRGGPWPPGKASNLRVENFVSSPPSCTFVWDQSSPAATDFYFELKKSGVVYFGTWTTGTWLNSPSFETGTYTWRVLTKNAGGYGPWASWSGTLRVFKVTY